VGRYFGFGHWIRGSYDVYIYHWLCDRFGCYNNLPSTFLNFRDYKERCSRLALGIAANPVPGEKSKHPTKADAPIAIHDLPARDEAGGTGATL
jgi:hypothetical protein